MLFQVGLFLLHNMAHKSHFNFSPVDNRPVFSVEKSPDGQDTLYKKLGIDLSMTVPDTSKAVGKLCPELRTPGLTLINDLGLQLSETKMNSPEMLSASPRSNQRFENVKRKIIDEKPKFDYSTIAGYILDLIEKVSRNINGLASPNKCACILTHNCKCKHLILDVCRRKAAINNLSSANNASASKNVHPQ